MKSFVKDVMEKQGVTLRNLEDATGLTHVTILHARSNERILKCKLQTLVTIAAALGVAVKDLFDEDPGID